VIYCQVHIVFYMEMNDWNEISKSYHEWIISPFQGADIDPLYERLEGVSGRREKSVADFGCGFFYLGKFLSEHYKSVHGSDFSEEMVKTARLINGRFKNVRIMREDMRTMRHDEAFDVVVIVNSVIMPSLKDIKKSFVNIHRSLKRGGSAFMILPSMESVIYHGMLLLNNELARRTEESARKTAKRRFEKRKYDLFLGYYKDDDQTQKFYYMHEIQYLLKKTGFRDIRFDKVRYSWDAGVSDFQPFPKEDPLWDWLVTAKK